MPNLTPIPSPVPDQSSEASLIDILYAEHALTDEQYKAVKVKSASVGQSTDEVLRSMNIVPEAKIAEAKAKMLGVPYISLSAVAFSPQALSLLPRSVVE